MQSAEADFYNEAKSSGYWEKEMTLAMRIFVHLVLAIPALTLIIT